MIALTSVYFNVGTATTTLGLDIREWPNYSVLNAALAAKAFKVITTALKDRALEKETEEQIKEVIVNRLGDLGNGGLSTEARGKIADIYLAEIAAQQLTFQIKASAYQALENRFLQISSPAEKSSLRGVYNSLVPLYLHPNAANSFIPILESIVEDYPMRKVHLEDEAVYDAKLHLGYITLLPHGDLNDWLYEFLWDIPATDLLGLDLSGLEAEISGELAKFSDFTPQGILTPFAYPPGITRQTLLENLLATPTLSLISAAALELIQEEIVKELPSIKIPVSLPPPPRTNNSR
jgi:hypothetical protein